MESPPSDLLCGVCNSLFNDPHTMPCEHTFCLRPCLLRIPGASEAVCIFCEIQVEAGDLEANSEIADRVSKFKVKLQQKSSSCAKDSHFPQRCSSCRTFSVQGLCFCAHCDAEICTICEENHLNYYRTLLQQRLRCIDPMRKNLKNREIKMKNEVGRLKNSVSKHTNAIDVVINEIQKVADDALLETTSIVEIWEKKDMNQLETGGAIVSDLVRDSCCVKGKIDNLQQKSTVKEIIEHVKTIQQLIERVNALDKTGEIKKKLVVNRLVVSKVFKTVGLQLDGFPLLNKIGSLPFLEKSRLTSNTTPLPSQTSNNTPSEMKISANYSSVKFFVGGLRRNLNKTDLEAYFSQFGDISDTIVARDHDTGDSLGYGYVTFCKPASLDSTFSVKKHVLGGGRVDIRRFKIVNKEKSSQSEAINAHRLFIGNIKDGTSEEDLKTYFSRFGTIQEVAFIRERGSGKFRGFGFVSFHQTEAVKCVLSSGPHFLHNWKLNIRVAISKDEISGHQERLPVGDKKNLHSQLKTPRLSVGDQRNSQSQQTPKLPVGDEEMLHSQLKTPRLNVDLYMNKSFRVGQIPPDVIRDDLVRHFSQFGQVIYARIMEQNRERIALVQMVDKQSRDKVLNNKRHVFGGRAVSIRPTFKQEAERLKRVKKSLQDFIPEGPHVNQSPNFSIRGDVEVIETAVGKPPSSPQEKNSLAATVLDDIKLGVALKEAKKITRRISF